MLQYDELKQRLTEIAEILKKFPETVQPQVYELLVEAISAKEAGQRKSLAKLQTKKEPKHHGGGKSKDTSTLLKDLDLKGAEGKQSFKDFVDEKKPDSAIQFNAVSVYYLSEILELKGITKNHVYTCYDEAKRRNPKKFLQSLRDTAGKSYGYIDISDDGIITIPLRGKNLVEHDLPKKDSKK